MINKHYWFLQVSQDRLEIHRLGIITPFLCKRGYHYEHDLWQYNSIMEFFVCQLLQRSTRSVFVEVALAEITFDGEAGFPRKLYWIMQCHLCWGNWYWWVWFSSVYQVTSVDLYPECYSSFMGSFQSSPFNNLKYITLKMGMKAYVLCPPWLDFLAVIS